MSAKHIFGELEQSDTAGADAHATARVCFLEWALTLEGEATTTAARLALKSPEAQSANSQAARAFAGFLRDAVKAMPHATPRRRENRRENRRSGRGLHC